MPESGSGIVQTMKGNEEAELSLPGRAGLGLLLFAGGGVGVLAAFDRGPLSTADINGPPWLAAAAGGVFFLSGLLVAAGPTWRRHPATHVIGFLILAGLGAIGNWIAFGPGPRVCSAELGGISSDSWAGMSDLGCRAGFGLGAVMIDGILFWLLASGIRKALGPGRPARFIEKLADGVMLICLSPILVPLVLAVILKSMVAVALDYARTGQWPRNQAFIARMKKRSSNLEG